MLIYITARNSGTIYNFNKSLAKLHEKIEFIYEGKIRHNFYFDGKYYDTLMYGMTIDKFHI